MDRPPQAGDEARRTIYELELDRLRGLVRSSDASRVLVQMPSGIRPHALEVAKAIEEAGSLPVIQADPCHGACDVPFWAAEALGAKLIVHYGHSRMLEAPPGLEVHYFEARLRLEVDEVVREALELLKPYGPVGLATTVQHIGLLPRVAELVQAAGHEIYIGPAGGRACYDGQVLGCDFTTVRAIKDRVDAFLVLGSRFHALGVAIATGRPTVMANPYEHVVADMGDEARRALARRYASVEEARGARCFGIIIGLKPGQMRLPLALRAYELVKGSGREAMLLAANEIRPEYLADFRDVDVFVNTACPRLSLEDAGAFDRPLLTYPELLVALGHLRWEELCEAGWFAAPGS